MIPSGRGAAMQRFLEELKEERENNEVGRTIPSLPTETNVVESMAELAIARPSGRGRGFQSLPPQKPTGVGYYELPLESNTRKVPKPVGREPSEPARGREPSEPVGGRGPPEPVGGRGRSALMAAFLAQLRAEDNAPGRSPIVSGTSASRTSTSLCSSSSATESFQKTYVPSDSSHSSVLTSQPTEETERRIPVIQKGSYGQEREVVCNYIKLDVAPGKGVFDYSVIFAPPEDNISMRTRMINQHLDKLGGVKSYNGVRLLLSIELRRDCVFECDHPADRIPVTMTLSCRGPAAAKDAADVYNMLFRRIMVHLGLKNMGRKFFDPSGAVNIPSLKLEVWPGYVTAVQQFEGGIQLCCDASHRVMRTQDVLSCMAEITKLNRNTYREEILKTVLGAVVLTRYNNRVYRVDDVAWDQSPMSTFKDSSGQEITFASYYKSQYDIEIMDKKQPLLISRVDRKKDNAPKGVPQEVRMICLIPELCYITGLTDAMRADFRVMRELTQKLQLTPIQRYEGLCKFLDNIKRNKQSQELLHKWGLHVSDRPVHLMAREMFHETLLYGNEVSCPLQPGKTSWVVKDRLLVPKSMANWVIMFVDADERTARQFGEDMKKLCAQMGMKVNSPTMIRIPENRNEIFLHTLRSAIRPGLQMVVIFFPSLRSDRYAAIKKVCCIEMPIPSQVIHSRTLGQKDKSKIQSITKKIAMQINCKLGGALWGLKINFKKLMICGMDVYHGSAGKHISVMGFVATSNELQTSWYSRVAHGANHQELADSLRLCMLGALQKYHEANGYYPQRIIMFRDGVGDGQLSMTKKFEVPQMLQSFPAIGNSYSPSLTVVVCQKRIMARIMAIQGGSASRPNLQNPVPGTVMDHTVTRHDWYDFFLVSQSSNRGTVSPTHYIVVHDDGNIKPDHIQRITYTMTHLYYNWTGTISIPAPAQYAHRLAQLVGQHLHKDPSSQLNDKLYFL